MPIVKYPSEGEPTREVTAPVIVTKDGAQIVHEDAVTQIPKSVADHIINGDIDPDATDKGGTKSVTDEIISGVIEETPDKEKATQSVTDHIITGQTEATPTRDEGLTSVASHVVSGEVANTATDNGAMQAPTLPVVVSSGKLGPSANYGSFDGPLIEGHNSNEVSDGASATVSADAGDILPDGLNTPMGYLSLTPGDIYDSSFFNYGGLLVLVSTDSSPWNISTTNLTQVVKSSLTTRYANMSWSRNDIQIAYATDCSGWSISLTNNTGLSEWYTVDVFKLFYTQHNKVF